MSLPSTRLSNVRRRRWVRPGRFSNTTGRIVRSIRTCRRSGKEKPGSARSRSPLFKVDTDTIRFTICGHDGPDGKRGENLHCLGRRAQGHGLEKDCGTRRMMPCKNARGTSPSSRVWKSASKSAMEFRTAPSPGSASAALTRVPRCVLIFETVCRTAGIAQSAKRTFVTSSLRVPCRFNAMRLSTASFRPRGRWNCPAGFPPNGCFCLAAPCRQVHR